MTIKFICIWKVKKAHKWHHRSLVWKCIRNLLTSGLDSGSSWLDGVNGILMQQEPNSPKQDYWNWRAIASLANTLITVVEPVPMPLLSSMLAAATALEMSVWNTVVISTLVLIHITIINCERETNDAKGNVRGKSSLQSISSSRSGNK
jgi:hypothetical protein